MRPVAALLVLSSLAGAAREGDARPQAAVRNEEPAGGEEPFPFDPIVLIREVVKGQRRAEKALSDFTYDQLEVRTSFARDGRPKETVRKLFAVFSGDEPGLSSRELVAVDGRKATEEERKEQAEADAKSRLRALQRRAADRAASPSKLEGDDDDPLVGRRRLSDLVDRYEYRVSGAPVLEGRPAYVLEFTPRPGLKASSATDRALNALAGRVVVDASDFQVRSVEAGLVSPFKLAGGLAANVRSAAVTFTAGRLEAGTWFPCLVDIRLSGRTALVVRLDAGLRVELSGFRTFRVETAATVASGQGQGAPPDDSR